MPKKQPPSKTSALASKTSPAAKKAAPKKAKSPATAAQEGASREVEVEAGHQDVHLTRRCPIRSGHLRVIARSTSSRLPLARAHSCSMSG